MAWDKKPVHTKPAPTPTVKLPRTGIEYPFMVNRPRFNDMCHTYEPINTHFSQSLCDEYARMDAEKNYNSNLGPNDRIVYDSIEYPPQKKDGAETPYLDDNDLVEITQDENPVD